MKNNVNFEHKINQRVIISAALLVGISSSYINQANAHAFTQFPKARQSICQAQGGYWWPADGANIPNLACKAAFLQSGYVPFVQEHEISVNVADYYNQAAVEAAVPDGTLCSAGSAEKSGLNLPSPHWQKTVVKPDADGKLQIRFNAQTPHNPSYWKIYLSNENFNADTDALGWGDVELIAEHGNIDFTVDPDGNRYYDMEVTIPKSRAGNAVLFSRWQRNDPAGEGFYNCSDITIEQDGVEPDQWQSLSYFVKQGQNAQVTDSIWSRLFDETGQEIISHMYEITADNQANWQASLAAVLSQQYANDIQIGVKDADKNIHFDNSNLFTNQVWATNKNYSFQLSIETASENTAPIVAQIDDVSVNENQTVDIHVHAFDDQNDPLTFTWTVPQGLSMQGNGADVSLSANSVEEDTRLTVSVAVSDGQLSTLRAFSVNVKNVDDLPDVPAWLSTKAYKTGDKVSYNSKVYVAKWWNKNEQPDSSFAWGLSEPDDGNTPTWNSGQAYQGGDEVLYSDNRYRAKWWTQGDEPGVADVWEKR
ncbi:lytic polysaccharide monooxygenase [Colwelliaceae bacterium 6441]